MAIICFLTPVILTAQPTICPPEMIFVEGDTFNMGCTQEQERVLFQEGYEEGCQTDWASDELPVHPVVVKQFFLSKYEITQSQWATVMPNDSLVWTVGLGASFPAYQVSWYDALTFCNRLSIREGFTPCYYADPDYETVFDSLVGRHDVYVDVYWNTHANGYRLPTEAEWEFAARGGNQSKNFPFSGHEQVNEVAVFANNNPAKKCQRVGTHWPNELGFYDMSGNEWEWVWDSYDQDYYSQSPSCQPIGPLWGEYKVCRGGNWRGSTAYARVANRIGLYPGIRTYNIGFRICRGKITEGYCMDKGA